MEAKLKVITIGDYNISILKNYFKDNENIEFLKLALDKSIDNLNTNFSKRDIVFLRTNAENLEKLLEVGKSLKEKEIVGRYFIDGYGCFAYSLRNQEWDFIKQGDFIRK